MSKPIPVHLLAVEITLSMQFCIFSQSSSHIWIIWLSRPIFRGKPLSSYNFLKHSQMSNVSVAFSNMHVNWWFNTRHENWLHLLARCVIIFSTFHSVPLLQPRPVRGLLHNLWSRVKFLLRFAMYGNFHSHGVCQLQILYPFCSHKSYRSGGDYENNAKNTCHNIMTTCKINTPKKTTNWLYVEISTEFFFFKPKNE